MSQTLPERLRAEATRAFVPDSPLGSLMREAADRIEALEAALRWAMSAGHLSYSQRLKQNADYCDAVDRALLESK